MPPAQGPSAKKAPAKKAPVKMAPANKTPAKKAPVKKTPVNKAPVKKTPVNKAPVKKTPVNKAPVKKTSAKKAPVRKHPPRKGPRVRRGTAPTLLLEAAQELFAERGPYATTTKQVAERAKVSEDLIFRYYGSKNGLLKEAVFRPMLELIESITPQWIAAQAEETGDEREGSRKFVGMMYDLTHGNRTIVMSMVQVMVGGPGHLDDADVRKLSSSIFEPEAPGFDAYLKARGLRRTDPKLQLRILMILIGSTAAFLAGTYADPADVPDRDTVIDELVDFMHYGLKFPD